MELTVLQRRSSTVSCICLAFVVVYGVFNRITFPAFVVIPGMQLLPLFRHRLVTSIICMYSLTSAQTALYCYTCTIRIILSLRRYCD